MVMRFGPRSKELVDKLSKRSSSAAELDVPLEIGEEFGHPGNALYFFILREELAEVAWVSVLHTSGTPPWGGVHGVPGVF